LSLSDGRITFSEFGPGIPDLETELAIDTADDGYHVRLQQITATVPDTSTPFASAPLAEGVVHPDQIWDRRIESLRIQGLTFLAGDDFRALTEAASQATLAAAEAPGQREPESPGERDNSWRVSKFLLEDSQVTIEDVVPLLDPASFQIAFAMDDLPLTPDGLRQEKTPQRVEIAQLSLNSAYKASASAPVAKFDSIFIDFTLAGLFEQRLDKVEIVSPTIYVGESLFWYVDHFRKFAAREAAVEPAPSIALASNDPQAGLASAARLIATAPPAPKGWSIDRLEAKLGQLAVAPTGWVLDALPPLPFSCATELRSKSPRVPTDPSASCVSNSTSPADAPPSTSRSSKRIITWSRPSTPLRFVIRSFGPAMFGSP
jgi:hypothetical protein